MTSTTCEIISLHWLLEHMADNKKEVFHEWMKRIEVDYHVTRWYFKTTGTTSLLYILSSNQVVDLFTKFHTVAHFRFLVDKLSMFISS